jgi:outer membrane lipoprotein carrier protein
MRIIITTLLSICCVFALDFRDKTTFEAVFKQSIINSSNSEIIYNGKLYIKEPALVLWRYDSPVKKDVYINDDEVIIIEPELEQVIVSKLQKELNILKILNDAKKINSNTYETTLYDTKYFLQIKNNELEKISYKDELDNKVTISFTDIRSNHQISNKTFKYTIPSDFDILRK